MTRLFEPRPHGKRWTREEDLRLQDMLKSGMNPAEIARKLKRTVAAVHSRKTLLKAKPKG